MVKLTLLFITLSAAMVAKTYAQYIPGDAQCGCFNLVQIDKPSSISDCHPKFKFLNQVNENYNNLFTALQINSKPYGCDLAQYRSNVYGMKTRTVDIIDAYFSCTSSDCTPAIVAAYARFVDFRTKTFNPYTYCSMANLSPDCAQTLLQVRSPVYGSAENIMVAMLTCAKLRAQSRIGIHKVSPVASFTQLVLSKKVSECNCVKIDPRPIPTSQDQCFSTGYIATVKNFIKVNFERVFSLYDLKKDSCDYTELLGYLHQIKDVTFEMAKLLESTSSKLTEFDAIQARYFTILAQYSLAVRNYILNNNKSCYLNVRATRISPLTINSAVIAIAIKCLQYVDVPNKRC